MGGQKCFEFNWFWNYTFELHCMWSDTWCMNCIAYEGIDMNSIWKETYMNCLAFGGIRLTCTADGTIDWNCKRSDKFELHYIRTHTWIALQMRKYVCKRRIFRKTLPRNTFWAKKSNIVNSDCCCWVLFQGGHCGFMILELWFRLHCEIIFQKWRNRNCSA